MDGIWRDIQALMKTANYSPSDITTIINRWQIRILGLLPSAINKTPIVEDEIPKYLFLLEKKSWTKGDEVLLETLRYLLIPGKFNCEDLNDFLQKHSIKYKYVAKRKDNLVEGKFTLNHTQYCNSTPLCDELFISHSSNDAVPVRRFYDLLEVIGVPENKIFCSTIPERGVPLGEDIYTVIKNQLLKQRVHVVFMLSNNYYNSVACLNEMGAAWILQASYTTFLLPGFEYREIKGAINAGKIGIKLDAGEEEVFSRLTEFKDKLCGDFKLQRVDERKWHRKVVEFIETFRQTQPL